MEEGRGRQKDGAGRARAGAHVSTAGGLAAQGLAFQSGTGLDESVYSATASDIPFSCPKKSPLKNGSAGE